MSDSLRWSIALIGLAIALAPGVGIFLPTGERWAVLLPLIAGAGIGIAGLALGATDPNGPHANQEYEHVFLRSSIAGFVTVVAGLAAVWLRARPPVTLPSS